MLAAAQLGRVSAEVEQDGAPQLRLGLHPHDAPDQRDQEPRPHRGQRPRHHQVPPQQEPRDGGHRGLVQLGDDATTELLMDDVAGTDDSLEVAATIPLDPEQGGAEEDDILESDNRGLQLQN